MRYVNDIIRAMALRSKQIRLIAEYLDRYRGSRVTRFTQTGKSVFCFNLGRDFYLTLDLDNRDPCLFMGEEENGKNISTPLSAMLRKMLSGATIAEVKQENRDRVIRFSFHATNEVFEPIVLHLIAEFIPTKSNLALLDENDRILVCLRSNTILDPRPIFHGITYTPPLQKAGLAEDPEAFDVEEYLFGQQAREDRLREERKRTVYEPLYRQMKARIKSLKHKIKQIESDIDTAKKHVSDSQYGTYIFTYPNAIALGDKTMDYYGESIPLDPRKSPNQNADAFFKRAKKAKTTIALGEENLVKAQDELRQCEDLLFLASSCDEEALPSLMGYLKLGAPQNKKKEKTVDVRMPCIIRIEGTSYLFGRNAKENDYLTFSYSHNGNFLWFHPKDKQGAHLLLAKENPSEKEIGFACELALLCSKEEDGEVQYAPRKSIRKGSVPGQVILSSYQSAYIRHISSACREAFLEASKSDTHHG